MDAVDRMDDGSADEGDEESMGTRLLNLSEADVANLTTVPEVTQGLEICVLHHNKISDLTLLQMVTSLRLLDLSDNRLEALPSKNFWGQLVNLEICYLHNNMISSLLAVEGLTGCPKLQVLSLYRNPVALHPAYRQLLVHGIASLVALDYYIVSDEEYLKGYNFGPRYGAFSACLRIPDNLEPNGPSMTAYSRASKGIRNLLKAIAVQYLNNSPAAKIQRAYRKYCLTTRANQAVAVMLLQPVARGFLTRRRLLRGKPADVPYIPSEEARAKTPQLAPAPHRKKRALDFAPSTWLSWGEDVDTNVDTSLMDVYFLPASEMLMADLLYRACGGSEEKYKRVATFSRTSIISLVEDEQLHRALHPERTFEQAYYLCKMKLLVPAKDQRVFDTVKRRGVPVWWYERQRLNDIFSTSTAYYEAKFAGQLFMRYRISDPKVFLQLIDLIKMYNADGLKNAFPIMRYKEPFTVPIITRKEILESTAALCIQNTWRSYYARRSLVPSLAMRVLVRRSVVLLQRWWRNEIFHMRMMMLTYMKYLLMGIESNELYVSVSAYNQLRHRLRFSTRKLFPEDHMQLCLDQSDHVHVFEDPDDPARGETVRQGLPEWVGVDSPVYMEPERPLQERIDSKTLVDAGTQVMPVQQHPASMALLQSSTNSINDDLIYCKFANLDEARLRAALLLLRTWDTKSSSYVCFMSLEALRENAAATVIGRVWRGYWVRKNISRLRSNINDGEIMPGVPNVSVIVKEIVQNQYYTHGNVFERPEDRIRMPMPRHEVADQLEFQNDMLNLLPFPPPREIDIGAVHVETRDVRHTGSLQRNSQQQLLRMARSRMREKLAVMQENASRQKEHLARSKFARARLLEMRRKHAVERAQTDTQELEERRQVIGDQVDGRIHNLSQGEKDKAQAAKKHQYNAHLKKRDMLLQKLSEEKTLLNERVQSFELKEEKKFEEARRRRTEKRMLRRNREDHRYFSGDFARAQGALARQLAISDVVRSRWEETERHRTSVNLRQKKTTEKKLAMRQYLLEQYVRRQEEIVESMETKAKEAKAVHQKKASEVALRHSQVKEERLRRQALAVENLNRAEARAMAHRQPYPVNRVISKQEAEATNAGLADDLAAYLNESVASELLRRMHVDSSHVSAHDAAAMQARIMTEIAANLSYDLPGVSSGRTSSNAQRASSAGSTYSYGRIRASPGFASSAGDGNISRQSQDGASSTGQRPGLSRPTSGDSHRRVRASGSGGFQGSGSRASWRPMSADRAGYSTLQRFSPHPPLGADS
eukprot:Rmarinus@m.1724